MQHLEVKLRISSCRRQRSNSRSKGAHMAQGPGSQGPCRLGQTSVENIVTCGAELSTPAKGPRIHRARQARFARGAREVSLVKAWTVICIPNPRGDTGGIRGCRGSPSSLGLLLCRKQRRERSILGRHQVAAKLANDGQTRTRSQLRARSPPPRWTAAVGRARRPKRAERKGLLHEALPGLGSAR